LGITLKRLDIAVAGAGPGGLAAALALQRQGHKVVVPRYDLFINALAARSLLKFLTGQGARETQLEYGAVWASLPWPAVFTPLFQSDPHIFPWLRDTLVATSSRLPIVQRLLASIVAGTLVAPIRTDL
jgi:FAD binding domain